MVSKRWAAGRRWLAKRRVLAALVAVVAVGGIGWGATTALASGTSAPRNAPTEAGRQPGGRSGPLAVVGATPAPGTTISGVSSLNLQLSAPLAARSPVPIVSPAVPGVWVHRPGNVLSFVPQGAFPPSSSVSVTVPSGPSGLRPKHGTSLAAPVSFSWKTPDGSVLRLQQLLATLGYLPVTWAPTNPAPLAPAQQAQAAFVPPPGTFSWSWAGTPPTSLVAAWAPGQSTVMLRGAIMAFERTSGLPVDGVTSAALWEKLLQTASAPPPATSSGGYTYALVSKASPETLTVWHNGAVVVQTDVNTGISQDPTVDGTFPVYEHLASQVMSGTNPDGSHYADPVQWVAYFNGGDAIHYISRSSFGYPQSLGCVEVPYAAGEKAWPYLQLGSLVTVTG